MSVAHAAYTVVVEITLVTLSVSVSVAVAVDVVPVVNVLVVVVVAYHITLLEAIPTSLNSLRWQGLKSWNLSK